MFIVFSAPEWGEAGIGSTEGRGKTKVQKEKNYYTLVEYGKNWDLIKVC